MSKPSLISCCNICKRPCDTMYHRGSILQSYLDKDIYNSCKAAKLAAVQAILPLSLISTKLSVSGRINSSAPVSLFMAVCSDKSFFSAAKKAVPLSGNGFLGIMLNFDRTHPMRCIWGALNISLGCNFFRFCTPPHSSYPSIPSGVQVVHLHIY